MFVKTGWTLSRQVLSDAPLGLCSPVKFFYYRTKNKLSNEIFVDLAAFFLEFSPFLSIWPLFFSNCLDFCRFWPEFEEKAAKSTNISLDHFIFVGWMDGWIINNLNGWMDALAADRRGAAAADSVDQEG